MSRKKDARQKQDGSKKLFIAGSSFVETMNPLKDGASET